MRASSAIFAALVFASALCAPAMNVTTNLFVETFSAAEGTWSTGKTFSDSTTDNHWTAAGTVKSALGGAKLGTSNGTGTITSDTIPLRQANAAAALSIYVQAAGYPGYTNGVLKLTALDANGDELRQWTTNLAPADVSTATDLSDMESAASFDFTFDFATSVPFKLSITTGGGDKRVLVGEVRVTETYDDGRIQLATPVVSVSPDVHQLLLFFTSVDEHATDFELEVLDPEGREAGTQQLYPGFGFMVTDLEEGTTYTVRLRALGDGVVYAPSEWYEEQISTTADNWQPVWTVGTPDSLPTIGKEFSFGVSAALANGTPQTVSFGGLTPAAPGAQPVFSGGVFSWTPGDEAAGSYTASFSVVNQGGTYTTDVAFRVRGLTEEATLFWEDFPNYDNAWSSTVDVVLPTTDTRVPGWTGEKLYKARSAVKLGKTSDYGSATTPEIETANGAAATVKLSLDAAAYAGKTGTLGITATDAGTSAVLFSTNVVLAVMASNTIASLSEYPIGPFSFAAAGTFKVSFARVAGDGRMGIDSVKVTQTVSTSLVDLDAPAGLAVVDGTLSTNSFSVAWTAVENATNYEVRVFEAGGLQPVRSLALAAPPAVFGGLADDTAYTVRVRAEGDTELYNYSPWASVSVRTLRSTLNPTLAIGPWSNAAPGNTLYGVIENTASVSAALDDGTPVDVFLGEVSPVPNSPPFLEGGTLSWKPDAEDEGKTFVLAFEMVPVPGAVYATNVSFKVSALPDLAPPDVTAGPVAWNAFGLSWDVQYRATRYGVRVWTGSPNPDGTATRVEESFAQWPDVKPAGWTFHNMSGSYKDANAPVSFDATGDWMETYDLGGAISSVSFHAAGHSISNSASTLTVVGIGADDAETVLGTLGAADIGQTVAGIDRTYSVPAGSDIRRIAWRYVKDKGGVGVGSVVIEGTGFPTAKFLPGWGPAAKNVGLVQSCTVAKPRPGRYLGVNPANRKEDLTEPCVNYAEVRVRDAAGTTLSTVVEVTVPAPPRSARATMLIAR